MPDVRTLDFSRIAQDLQIRKVQVESVVQLLDEGNTVPFITRYRKERTGGLNEDAIRLVQTRVGHLRQLADRKQTILKSIENQGKLTDDLRQAILSAETHRRLEDLYLPYKPKKKTLASVARERGLDPLAQAIWARDPAVLNLAEIFPTLVNPEKELKTPEDVQLGVRHILAEQFAETAEVRASVRVVLWETGKLTATKSESVPDGQGLDFKDYFKFTESARQIPPHRVLAINRGEKEGVLKVTLERDADLVRNVAESKLPLADHPHADFLKTVLDDALSRLVLPSLEREIRRELTEESEGHAVKVFARNLRCLLLQPPLPRCRLLAIDPGFRTGCKLAVLDETGNLLEEAVIFPHPPQNKKADAKIKLEELVRKHRLPVIAIGNGTACRETEEVVSDLVADLDNRRKNPRPPGQVSQPAPSPVVDQSEHPTAAPAFAPPSTSLPTMPAVPPGVPEEPVESLPEAATPDAVSAEAGRAAPAKSAVSPSPSESNANTAALIPAAVKSPPIKPVPPPINLDSLPAAPEDLAYVIVNEAGASVYSASPVGREEFPDFDATLRGTISIGRRLQDPLSELVKIDPQSIGVGLYQHDVNPRYLKESLDAVIESSVNHVGIDLNTASVPLLRHLSGFNQLVAREVVGYRKQHGPFKTRAQILQVPNMGPARFVQAAGFLKIPDGDDPLDQTWIHPESYAVAQQILSDLGYAPEALNDKAKSEELQAKLRTLSPEEVGARLQIGALTVKDILDALVRPGRDPREDLPPPIFKKGILKLEDLSPGMELKGTVLNVVDFGGFVDIGLKDSGLVHISQMASRYIRNPYDLVAVGDVVTVWVLAVDNERRRVSLTMIQPGTERKSPEKKPAQPRPARGGRPPRGRRPEPRQGQTPAPAAAPPTALPSAEIPAAARQSGGPPRTPRPGPPPRKPKRQLPKPHLSQAALERKVPLRSFRELEVFFETKPPEDQAPPPS